MADDPVKIVKDYLARMAEIRGAGGATDETSYYSAFENLVNAIGKHLNPNVICNGQLKSIGAGHPDFGLYSKKQCAKGTPKKDQGDIPERGVVEAKGVDDDSLKTSIGAQTKKYLDRYGLALVTNYREFRLMALDDAGNPVQREYFSLANDEASFWELATAPKKVADAVGHRLVEFLKRVLMNAAPITRAEDVAWFLASYARDALTILEEKDASSLAPLREALEVTLGIKFEGEKAEHFFRSTLIQTLFYGLFSAWVMEAKRGAGKFDWRLTSHILTVPMVRSLFEEIAKPTRLNLLDLNDILDRTGEALNRIKPVEFLKSFGTEHAVQHFYEPFLEAFDPDLRKEMGVWYTPLEIVKYMVERVDKVLRTELDVADGLADKNVYVLDPCCGTGTYIVEVLKKIEETLRKNGADALLGEDVKEAAQKRIFGFEIMSAPFMVAHWQIGNLLESLGAALDPAKNERPAVYLTNALTGWEPPMGAKATLSLFPELQEERDQAEHVKRDIRILVVLGNPPYNAFAGTSPEEEQGLVEPYKDGLANKWGIKKFNLDELYVRFIRIAERRITESGKGIFCYISNASYVSDPSFVVMREHLLSEFDDVWIDNMNGDSRETGKKTPDGAPDPSVFSTKYNRAGIKVGTSVGLFVRQAERAEKSTIRYRNFWGVTKREELLKSVNVTSFDEQYEISDPQAFNKLSFRPGDVSKDYLTWPKLQDLCAVQPVNGLMEKRGGALIDIKDNDLSQRMQTYFDKGIGWEGYKLLQSPLAKDASRFDARKAREKVLGEETFDVLRIVRYFVRPFDTRYCYYTGVRPVWNEPRPTLWDQYQGGNKFLISRPAGVAVPEGVPFHYTTCLSDNDAIRGHAYCIPFTKHVKVQGALPATEEPNLNKDARSYLTALGYPNPDKDIDAAEAIWLHSLAIGFSPKYLADNADGIAIDWPRIPLPDDKELLDASADLGGALAGLLNTEAEVTGVTAGTVAEHIRILGNISATDLKLTAGWGRKDKLGKVFPGKEKTETRDWSSNERDALKKGFSVLGISEARGFELLGRAVDVYLNDATYWAAIPEAVWNYYIGGYQVIKKWLSYREEAVLGRALTKDEAREVTAMVRRIAAIILMTDELDESYIVSRDHAYPWTP